MRTSNELLQSVDNEQWDDLSLQARYRDKLIREYFDGPITADVAIKMQGEIKRVLAIDELILGSARKQQGQVSTALRQLSKGNQAIAAYQEIQN